MAVGVYTWQYMAIHGNTCLYIYVRKEYCVRRRVGRNDMLRHLEINVVFLELQCAVVCRSVLQCVAVLSTCCVISRSMWEYVHGSPGTCIHL